MVVVPLVLRLCVSVNPARLVSFGLISCLDRESPLAPSLPSKVQNHRAPPTPPIPSAISVVRPFCTRLSLPPVITLTWELVHPPPSSSAWGGSPRLTG